MKDLCHLDKLGLQKQDMRMPFPSQCPKRITSAGICAVAILMCRILSLGALSAEFEKDGIRFSGSQDAVRIFREAALSFDELSRETTALRTKKQPRTAEEELRYREAEKQWYAVRETMFKTAMDLNLLPGSDNKAWEKSVDILSSRYDVWLLGGFMDSYQERSKDNPERYKQWLEDMLPAWEGHFGEPEILLRLGRLCEGDPRTALRFYDRAARETRDVDKFAFRHQEAWQGVARMNEKLGAYRDALAALKRWDIREPCGTGAEESRVKRAFWMLRLHRLSGDNIITLRAELMKELHSGEIPCDRVEILSLYNTDEAGLRQDITSLLRKLEETPKENPRFREHDIKACKAILTLLQEESNLAAMSDDELMASLTCPKRIDRDGTPHGEIGLREMFENIRCQPESDLALAIPGPTRFWVRTVHEALWRMPRLNDKLQADWRVHQSNATAFVLAWHDPGKLPADAKKQPEIQWLLKEITELKENPWQKSDRQRIRIEKGNPNLRLWDFAGIVMVVCAASVFPIHREMRFDAR